MNDDEKTQIANLVDVISKDVNYQHVLIKNVLGMKKLEAISLRKKGIEAQIKYLQNKGYNISSIHEFFARV